MSHDRSLHSHRSDSVRRRQPRHHRDCMGRVAGCACRAGPQPHAQPGRRQQCRYWLAPHNVRSALRYPGSQERSCVIVHTNMIRWQPVSPACFRFRVTGLPAGIICIHQAQALVLPLCVEANWREVDLQSTLARLEKICRCEWPRCYLRWPGMTSVQRCFRLIAFAGARHGAGPDRGAPAARAGRARGRGGLPHCDH